MANAGGWTDNYHTGYVLDCLDEFQCLSGDNSFSDNIKLGYTFYKSNFITSNGIPKFYYNNLYPIDCTSASQTILTLARFGDDKLANSVAKWTIKNMQKNDGSFKFRKYKTFTNSTSFMRWSNAWIFVALAALKCKI